MDNIENYSSNQNSQYVTEFKPRNQTTKHEYNYAGPRVVAQVHKKSNMHKNNSLSNKHDMKVFNKI